MKNKSFVLSFAFVLTIPMAAQAQFNFITNNGTVTITGYTVAGGEVVITNSINGLSVTGIGFRPQLRRTPSIRRCTWRRRPSVKLITSPGFVHEIARS